MNAEKHEHCCEQCGRLIGIMSDTAAKRLPICDICREAENSFGYAKIEEE